ncbi:MAG TPA: hypothetical protein VFV38_12950 [Ktedonobacteraceae bacterium]|nr:hypothetical protein [Ktedonobacteraceae bacterium]
MILNEACVAAAGDHEDIEDVYAEAPIARETHAACASGSVPQFKEIVSGGTLAVTDAVDGCCWHDSGAMSERVPGR